MESLNNDRDTALTRLLPPPNETSNTKNGLCPIELFAKEALWKPSNNSSYYQGCWLLSPNSWQGPIAKDNTSITHWPWRNQAGDYLEPSPFLTSVHGTGRYSAQYQKTKVNINPATNLSIYNDDLPTWWTGVIVA